MKQPGSPLPVEMHQVSRHFGSVKAVDNVSLDVPAGTVLGVIGPSGSGKTTIIRMLTGTLEPTAGSIRVLGENPRRFRRQTRERLGYMPQLFILYPDLTTYENVDFVASLFGLLWHRRRQRVREVLQFVDLWDARTRQAKQLSGGMQRRLELACALVHEPTLVFLDEPTAGIDPVLRQTFWDEFRRLRNAGQTQVVTTQYVGEAEYCDRVAVIAEGKLIKLAEPEQLRRETLGGDIIEVETNRDVDGIPLTRLPGVIQVDKPRPRKLLVTVDDAGAATPRVLEAITSQRDGDDPIEVTSSSEHRPSFDEVFAEILAQHNVGSREDGEGA